MSLLPADVCEEECQPLQGGDSCPETVIDVAAFNLKLKLLPGDSLDLRKHSSTPRLSLTSAQVSELRPNTSARLSIGKVGPAPEVQKDKAHQYQVPKVQSQSSAAWALHGLGGLPCTLLPPRPPPAAAALLEALPTSAALQDMPLGQRIFMTICAALSLIEPPASGLLVVHLLHQQQYLWLAFLVGILVLASLCQSLYFSAHFQGSYSAQAQLQLEGRTASGKGPSPHSALGWHSVGKCWGRAAAQAPNCSMQTGPGYVADHRAKALGLWVCREGQAGSHDVDGHAAVRDSLRVCIQRLAGADSAFSLAAPQVNGWQVRLRLRCAAAGLLHLLACA